MKKIIYVDEFCHVFADPPNSVMERLWTHRTLDMSQRQYKDSRLSHLEYIQMYRADYYLEDKRFFNFVITPELQDWVVKTLTPVEIDHGLKKKAVLLPEGYIEKLSVTQMMDDIVADHKITLAYFEKREEAFRWLMAKK
jgi:hypothetical protein